MEQIKASVALAWAKTSALDKTYKAIHDAMHEGLLCTSIAGYPSSILDHIKGDLESAGYQVRKVNSSERDYLMVTWYPDAESKPNE